MDEIIATCVQQQIRIFETHDEFRNDIQRFMRLAKIKESHLVVFPELSGILLAPPLAPGFKRTLLRVAERQVGKKPSLFDRMVGRAADSAADALGGIGKSLTDAVIEHESTIRDAYFSTFSEIARSYGMYIVGGSIYLPDGRDGQMHNTAYLFSPAGEVIGQQSKINLGMADKQLCQPGMHGLNVFETDFGRLGILIGQDVLYPENGRILTNNGALFIANLLAATSEQSFLKARNAFSARVQENFIFGAQSCLVGRNILGETGSTYVGKSVLLAPLEMTTRYSGKLGEVGTTVSESIISATWDIRGLYALRNTTDTPTNLMTDNDALQRQLRKLYGVPETLDGDVLAPPEATFALPMPEEPLGVPPVDELDILDSVTPQTPAATPTEAALPISEPEPEPNAEWGLSIEGDEYSIAPADATRDASATGPEVDWTFGIEPDTPAPLVSEEQVEEQGDPWAWAGEASEQEQAPALSSQDLETDVSESAASTAREEGVSASDLWWMEEAPSTESSPSSFESDLLISDAGEGTPAGDFATLPALEDSLAPIDEDAPARFGSWWPDRDDVASEETPAVDSDTGEFPDIEGNEAANMTGSTESISETDVAEAVSPEVPDDETDSPATADGEDTQSASAEDEKDPGHRFGRFRSWLGKRDT